jgi:KaiC/GvpD/RAD55 family RecA-like ATPase
MKEKNTLNSAAEDNKVVEVIWKTDVSKVYWNRKNAAGKDIPDVAKLCIGVEDPRDVSWFDELFLKGIKVFEAADDQQQQHPVTLLLKGPPGDGKTTLALELCYRLAKSDSHITSTYLSLESEGDQIINNLTKYGWKNEKNINTIGKISPETDEKNSVLNVCGSEYTREWSEKLSQDQIVKMSNLINIPLEIVMKLCSMPYTESMKKEIEGAIHKKALKSHGFSGEGSDILVIDSLNIIPIKSRTNAFMEFLKIAKKKESAVKLIIFILDGNPENDCNPFWEYMCDTIIEMNHHNENDYLIKTIEVVKSRFQKHLLGKHQIKIYDLPNLPEKAHVRPHPCIKEGGIFIFPSVHFYLSRYNKFAQEGTLEYDSTFPKNFNEFLTVQSKGGFPKGRCTALIGCRGGHKSHLAYLHILARLTGRFIGGGAADANNNTALIISLRDDDTMISSTLDGILENEVAPRGRWTTQQLINENRLEILFYPPGYISPEEFIHRIFVSIHKLKEGNKDVTVLFNSLDQLAARFPLCTKFDMFIPSIVQILIGEAITSIFVAVDEKDQPVEQYGLLPMADLILSFYKYKISDSDYHEITKKEKEDRRDEIIITVERFAGGRRAGAKGLLELANKDHKKDQKKGQKKAKIRPHLNFFTLPPAVYLDINQRRD